VNILNFFNNFAITLSVSWLSGRLRLFAAAYFLTTLWIAAATHVITFHAYEPFSVAFQR